jgi:hypothetical protein
MNVQKLTRIARDDRTSLVTSIHRMGWCVRRLVRPPDPVPACCSRSNTPGILLLALRGGALGPRCDNELPRRDTSCDTDPEYRTSESPETLHSAGLERSPRVTYDLLK